MRSMGLEVRLAQGGRTLVVQHGDAVKTWNVRRYRRTPRPSELDASDAQDLLWLPDVTPGVVRRLEALDASWVTDRGDFRLHSPRGVVTMRQSSLAAAETPVLASQMSIGALAILQHLLEHPGPTTQIRLAEAAEVTQPRVSQILVGLRRRGLVSGKSRSLRILQPDQALDVWLAGARPPDGIAEHWYSLERPHEQIERVRTAAGIVGAASRLCGDWAADQLAPWRLPDRIVFHVDRTCPLERAGFVPADPDTATVTLQVGPVRAGWGPDPSCLDAMGRSDVGGLVAPVTEVLREVLAGGASDAAQAAEELRLHWLRARAMVSG